MRAASTGRPNVSAWSMLIPASSSSERLNPTAGVIRFVSTEYTGRGGRRRFHGRFVEISKNCCQSRLPHILASSPFLPALLHQMRSARIRSLLRFLHPDGLYRGAPPSVAQVFRPEARPGPSTPSLPKYSYTWESDCRPQYP